MLYIQSDVEYRATNDTLQTGKYKPKKDPRRNNNNMHADSLCVGNYSQKGHLSKIKMKACYGNWYEL